jgi:hypothetical protein
MARSAQGGGRSQGQGAEGYVLRSQRPLEILVFLFPLIALYEIGLVAILRTDGQSVLTNKAHEALLRIFAALGVDAAAMSLPALSLPGILLVIVLLAWQVLSRRPWRVDLRTVGLMALESLALAIPLIAIAQLVVRAFDDPAPAALAAAAGEATALRELPVLGKIAVAIGAGLYEELVFRMLAIAMLHTLLVDACRLPERLGMTLAVVLSTVAFVVYHPLHTATGGIDWRRAAALAVIGLYLGAVYAVRGFGIVVGTHAAYDIAVLLLADP